jgi:mono/diheme cytochrome c family protein
MAIAAAVFTVVAHESVSAQAPASPRTGKQVFETTCIACHGPDGRAGVNLDLEKIAKPPDFTDCAFASREPDRGFLAVAHNGGPARGFSPLMPPWGTTYTEDELREAVAYLRTFCTDARWPRGELNLPRPLVTAKAFPEDEAVVTTTAASGNVVTKLIYEKRFGPLNQVEAIVPISTVDAPGGGFTGIGDVALEYKRTLAHSLSRGNIVSATAEFVLPTGSERKGLGGGTAVFEPFVTFGQILGRSGFVQTQVGFGIPFERGREREMFWRAAVGASVEQSPFGRVWSPMLEVLGARPLVSGAHIEWDLVPGVQATLNTRQHVRLAGGVRLPVTEASQRSKSVILYLLWDWYEGSFFQGW